MPLKELKKKASIYHVYYRRQGAYALIRENLVKIVIGAIVVLGIVVLLQQLEIFHPKRDAIYLKEHFWVS